jgi:hypothetical protein
MYTVVWFLHMFRAVERFVGISTEIEAMGIA